MNSGYCTPESSPVSDHGSMDMGHSSLPIDCSQKADEAVLDLCVRKQNPVMVPTTMSPAYTDPYMYPIKQESSPTRAELHYNYSPDNVSITPADTTMLPNSRISPTMFVPWNNTVVKAATRPFKAYPKDPSVLLANKLMVAPQHLSEVLFNQQSRDSYIEFRRKMLAQVNNNNVISNVTNPKMRRNSRNTDISDGNGEKDAAYWERRRKNNEAAKRSRDARRAKEDEIAIRAAFLENENMRLRVEVTSLRQEINELRSLINVKH